MTTGGAIVAAEVVMSAPPVCRHCCNPSRRVNRPRGLCWSCFYNPAVRDLYPPQSQVHDDPPADTRPPPPRPTSAEPGTEAKILVMVARARRRHELHHSDDRKVSLTLRGCRLILTPRGERPLHHLGPEPNGPPVLAGEAAEGWYAEGTIVAGGEGD